MFSVRTIAKAQQKWPSHAKPAHLAFPAPPVSRRHQLAIGNPVKFRDSSRPILQSSCRQVQVHASPFVCKHGKAHDQILRTKCPCSPRRQLLPPFGALHGRRRTRCDPRACQDRTHLVVLVVQQPVRLKSGQRGEDGAAQPHGVGAVGWKINLRCG